MAEPDRDSGRSLRHRLVPDRRRAGRAPQHRDHHRRGARQSRRGQRRAPDRGLLCRLSGSPGHRPPRRRAAAAGFGPDPAIASRRDLSAAIGASIARRRRSAERDQLRDRESFGVFVARGCSSRSAHGLSAAGGLGLPDRDLSVGDAGDDSRPRRLSLLYRGRCWRYGRSRRAGPRRPYLRSRNQDRAPPCRCRRRAGSAPGADLAPRRFRRPRAGLDWDAFFTAARLGGQDEIVACTPSRPRLSLWCRASRSTSGRTGWPSTRSSAAAVLPSAYDDCASASSRILSGQQQLRPRQRRAIGATSGALSAVAHLCRPPFPAGGQGRRPGDGAGIVDAFDRRLVGLEWMARRP